MKYILLLLLLPFAATAQKDFDYTVYTSRAKMPLVLPTTLSKSAVGTDSLYDVAWPRKIEKQGNQLRVINLNNPTECAVYSLHYINFSSDPVNYFTILYGDDHGGVILVNPCIPLVTIGTTQYY